MNKYIYIIFFTIITNYSFGQEECEIRNLMISSILKDKYRGNVDSIFSSQKTRNFSVLQIDSWFNELMDLSLDSKDVYKIGLNRIDSNCLSIPFIKNIESWMEGKEPLSNNPLLIFSNLIYLKKQVVGFVIFKYGVSRGCEIIYGFVFTYKNKKWKLVEMKKKNE